MATDLINENPLLKKPIRIVLAECEKAPAADRGEIEQAAWEQWDASFIQSPSVVVDALVRYGALLEQVLANGEPYDGTVDDMQLDASIEEDTVVESIITITERGESLLAAYEPSAMLRALFQERPHYADVFEAMLRACGDSCGCDRMALEAVINGFQQLAPREETGQTAVYPQYFIDALESAGGIEWDGTWRVTDAGRDFMHMAE